MCVHAGVGSVGCVHVHAGVGNIGCVRVHAEVGSVGVCVYMLGWGI